MKAASRFTTQAAGSIVDQADFYLLEGGERLERRWYVAVDKAVRSLQSLPTRGVKSTFAAPHLSELRFIKVPGFAMFLVFYFYSATENQITVVNILHGAREVDLLLNGPSS